MGARVDVPAVFEHRSGSRKEVRECLHGVGGFGGDGDEEVPVDAAGGSDYLGCECFLATGKEVVDRTDCCFGRRGDLCEGGAVVALSSKQFVRGNNDPVTSRLHRLSLEPSFYS